MKYLILILLSGYSLSQAQEIGSSSKIPGPIFETFHSNVLYQDYVLHITLPEDFSPGEQSYPVLYYLDAWIETDIINTVAKYQMSINQIDPMILVGISYNTDKEGWLKYRERDLVPSLRETDTIHYATNFLEFMKTELLPFIESKYAASPDDRGLLGYSFGGLFATWLLKMEPDLFQKLGIRSASLWYKKRSLFNDKELNDNINTIKKLEVFISCGSLEGEDMIQNNKELYNIMSQNKNINVTNVVFENENHSSAWVTSSNRAILHLYKRTTGLD